MDTNQQGSSTLLAGISLVSLSFVFLMCSIGVFGVICVISVKIKKMKRNIEILMKARKNTASMRVRSTIMETPSKNEVQASSDVQIDAEYAIPTVGPTVAAGVKPAQPETGCNTRYSGKGFQMDDNMAYKPRSVVEVFEMGGNVAYKQVNRRP